MRKTGSRESRDNREASATSPTSIAVKTFSIRLGSRRNHRPPHQKIRSITTVSPTTDTSKIGHMIGPPFRKLSTRKLPLNTLGFASTAGEALAAGDIAGLNVAVTLSPGAAGAGEAPIGPAGEVPRAGAGEIPTAGGGMGAPGCAGASGFGGAAGLAGATVGGAFGGGGGAGRC